MSGRRARGSAGGAVLLLVALSLLGTAPGAAAADDDLVSGVEGAKAALVRIEVSAIADIAHVDHSSGEVVVARGEYEVPIRSGTGVFTSKDGVIATTGSTLLVTEDQVVVYAANRLFTEQMHTALTGNDGDLSRRAQAVDPYWAPHLQHCYERVEHCILFFRPQYEVIPYTEEPTSTPADLIRAPEGAADVGLLRISGGGGTPTAEVAPSDQALPAEGLLAGFTQPPDPALPPGTNTVGIDAGTGALSAGPDLAAQLGAGMAGGPVLDPATGQVAGLVSVVDGQPTVVPAQRLQEVLAAAGTPPEGSPFDAVFRQGIDHLTSGHTSGPAASSFRESLTYYDSALAAQYLATTAGADDEMAGHPTAASADGNPSGGLWRWVVIGLVLLLLLLVLALLVRRRRSGGDGGPARQGPGSSGGLPVTVPSARPDPVPDRRPAAPAPLPAPAPSAAADRERTRLKPSPALLQEPRPRPGPPPQQSPAAFCWQCGGPLRAGAHYCAACGSTVT